LRCDWNRLRLYRSSFTFFIKIVIQGELTAEETLDKGREDTIQGGGKRNQWGRLLFELQVALLHLVSLVTLLLEERNTTEEEKNAGGEDWTENTSPLNRDTDAGADDEDPDPDKDLTEIVWMAGNFPQPNLAPHPTVLWIIPETELLLIADSLAQETRNKENNTHNVHGSNIQVFTTSGGIHEDDRKADSEHPNCLKDPEHCKPHRVRPLVIKAVILPYLNDSVQEIA